MLKRRNGVEEEETLEITAIVRGLTGAGLQNGAGLAIFVYPRGLFSRHTPAQHERDTPKGSSACESRVWVGAQLARRHVRAREHARASGQSEENTLSISG